MMKSLTLSLIALFVLVSAFTGCDTSAVNEPGVDIQAPTISITSPTAVDSLGDDVVPVLLTASDNHMVSRIELFLSNAAEPFAVLTTEPWESSFDASELAEGTHTLRAVAYDPEGNSASAKVTLRKGIVQVEEVLRMSLVEIVTSANCSPCGPQNEAYHTGTQSDHYKQRVATIKYHVWFPRPTDKLWIHAQEWIRPRVEYVLSPISIEQISAPKGWVGGELINNKGVDWIAAADADMQLAAGAKIELERTRNGSSIELSIKVTGITTSDYNDLHLHTVVTESDIEYNDGNSENIHYEVLRRMYPSASGEKVTLDNKQTAQFSRTIEIDPTWNGDHLEAVVFLQSQGSKHVLQAAKLHL